jgi:hypothetical protein
MEPLPMAPLFCSLDEAGLDAQLARYRAVGTDAVVLSRDDRRAVIRVSDGVDNGIVDELVAVERACCPFFELEWRAQERILTVAVPSAPHVPALDAILRALGTDAPPAAARPLENPLHTLVIGATPPGQEP